MKTTYAASRTLLAPTITTSTLSGSVVSGTYYFFLTRRNRAGYTSPSPVATVVLSGTGSVTIGANNFNTLSYEDIKETLISVSTTNDYATSRIIYKFNHFAADYITPITPADVVITANATLNSLTSYSNPADIAALTGLLTGFRVQLSVNGFCYEFLQGSAEPVDNITVLNHAAGRWFKTREASLYETTSLAEIDVISADQDTLLVAPLENISSIPIPIKYWIVNDTGGTLTGLRINLSEYSSDPAIRLVFGVKIIGYINLTSFVLDTTGIDNLGVVQEYPTLDIALNKGIPNGSAVVIEVTPSSQLLDGVSAQSFISIYPKLVNYSLLQDLLFWDAPVDNIAALKSLNSVQYKSGQVRLVESVNRPYKYDAASTASDNGDTVLIPNTNPTTGRWVVFDPALPDGSVGLAKLSSEVITALGDQIKTNTVTISSPTNYTIDLDADYDYLILKCPLTDISNTVTNINFTATLTNNQTKALIVELVQNTGAVAFDNTILFPSGTTPILSGNGKSDIILFSMRKDSLGIVKKRGKIATTDAG
jgi:hypothetical protein